MSFRTRVALFLVIVGISFVLWLAGLLIPIVSHIAAIVLGFFGFLIHDVLLGVLGCIACGFVGISFYRYFKKLPILPTEPSEVKGIIVKYSLVGLVMYLIISAAVK